MNHHTLARLLATTALLATPALTTSAFAQDGTDTATDLDTIIVSGGLTPIEADAYGRSSTILTDDEIEVRGIKTVQDALRAVPGVSVSSAGGNFTAVRIRGGESSHTLVLIDGVEAAGGDGEYTFSGLDTANIERIEVLRGPQSVFYGSNASAGVINIITRSGFAGNEYGFSFEVGDQGSTNTSAFVSTRDERGGLSLSISDHRDAGWDFSGDGGERDETQRKTFVLKGDYKVADSLKLGFNFRTAEEKYDFDMSNFLATDAATYIVDDVTQFSDRDERTVSLFAEHEMLGGRLVQRLAYELTDNEQGFGGFAPTNTTTEAYKYRVSYGLDGNAVTDANHLLNLLLEHESDRSSSNPLFSRSTDSIALEYRGSFGSGFDVQAGVRFDDNSVFSDTTTWNLGGSYTFGNGVRVHASAGTGVVNPTYFELYANAFGTVGNPNLRPEESESYDIGVEVPFLAGRGLIDVTYFNEKLKDEITWVPVGGGVFSYINQAGNSKRQGVEVTGEFAATDAIDLRLFYTYLDAEEPNGAVEVRRPEHELGVGITARAFGGRGSVSADVRYVADNTGNRFFPPFTPAKLPDYTVVDLAARYAVTDNVDATFRVENVFDETTSDVWGYEGRGRAFYIGLDANW